MVTRGNVAIYCYNALTAKTWDVTESTDGKLTSSNAGSTILVKYFSDFVNDANKMKLVEDAQVRISGANTTAIGANQIEIVVPQTGCSVTDIADFIDAKAEPRRGEEEVTYAKGTGVVAYVAEGVADLTVLQGKTIDVIFGKDNEVVYVNVTNDAIDRSYVTAWKYTAAANGNPAEGVIELNGEEYDVLDDASVYVLGYEVDCGNEDAYFVINDIMSAQNFAIANPKKAVERNIVVDVILTPKDKIESINFIGSVTTSVTYPIPVIVDGEDAGLKVYEDVVKKVTTSGKVTTFNSTISGKLEDLDEDKVTVVKDGEVIKAEDIKAGDVLTVLKVDGNVEKIYVSDARVTGTLDRVKNEIVTIDGEEYSAVASIFGNTDGDFEEIKANADLVEDYLGEEVEAYLNFMGEIAVVVSETESVPATMGIVTKVYEYEEDEDADDVEYLPVKILSAETGKATKYNIYNEDSEVDFDNDVATSIFLTEGAIVWFSADANNVIEYSTTPANSDILVVAKANLALVDNFTGDDVYKVDGKELKVAAIADGKVDEEMMEIDGKVFDDGITVYYNNHIHSACANTCEGDIEIIKGWASLVAEDDATGNTSTKNATLKNQLVAFDGDEVVFFFGNVTKYATSTEEYAIVDTIDTRKENGKTKTFVTLVGDATEYEVKTTLASAVEEGDFVKYELSDDKITVTEKLDAWTLAEAESDDTVTGLHTAGKKGQFEVDEVDGRRVRFVEYEEASAITALYLVKNTVTVYDLENGTVEKVDIEDLAAEIVGRYATGFKTDANDNYDIIVLF